MDTREWVAKIGHVEVWPTNHPEPGIVIDLEPERAYRRQFYLTNEEAQLIWPVLKGHCDDKGLSIKEGGS